MMSCKNKNFSLLSNLFKLLLLLILYSAAPSSSCKSECGEIPIPFPFGIGKGCYLEKYYEIECRPNTTGSRKLVPFLTVLNREVVSISLPSEEVVSITLPSEDSHSVYSLSTRTESFGLIRIKSPITSTGCSADGKDSAESIVNLTGSPFFFYGTNSLMAIGCNSKVSFTHINPNVVGCQSNCSMSKESLSNAAPFFDEVYYYLADEVCTEDQQDYRRCNGNGCCQASLPSKYQQVVGIRIESNDGNSTTTGEEHCRVAFLTDQVYTLLNVSKPQEFYARPYTTVSLGWIIQTKNISFLNNLGCKRRNVSDISSHFVGPTAKCLCDISTNSEITYASCGCIEGYEGNPYKFGKCVDIDECKIYPQICRERGKCENTPGRYRCAGDKTRAILIGVGSGFGVLVLVGGVWWLRKFIMKRRITKRKQKFFKRNGGLLLKKELNTREGNVETTKVFTSRELEKATENFSQNRVLGQGGQGTVYKGMLVDGRTVAVKISKVIDENKLQEFINEVVILSQINHRHVVKLLGCCLETEVPILVYEFILNGNVFQHIHEESDDYTMIWGMRLRIAVDIAGALSYLHSSASSPIYHRDIKSTNILLDEKYRAKVADFGTSRSITLDQTHWTTVVAGTVGYVDPEYYRSSQFTEKSDVYSYGVVLAELITGDKPVITIQNTRETISLVEHFRLAMKEKRLYDIMDARIKDDCKPKQVMAMANLAFKCLSSKGKKRPNMREVFMELERINTSPEDPQVRYQIEEEDEEEVMKIIKRSDSWSIGVTAPASTMAASSSRSDVQPLFSRLTW